MLFSLYCSWGDQAFETKWLSQSTSFLGSRARIWMVWVWNLCCSYFPSPCPPDATQSVNCLCAPDPERITCPRPSAYPQENINSSKGTGAYGNRNVCFSDSRQVFIWAKRWINSPSGKSPSGRNVSRSWSLSYLPEVGEAGGELWGPDWGHLWAFSADGRGARPRNPRLPLC